MVYLLVVRKMDRKPIFQMKRNCQSFLTVVDVKARGGRHVAHLLQHVLVNGRIESSQPIEVEINESFREIA